MARPEQITARELKFAHAYTELGGKDGVGMQAALLAGYSVKGAATAAYRLLRRPLVIEAIKKEVERVFSINVVVGSKILLELAQDKSTPPSVRAQCAESLLNRGGLQLVRLSENRITIEDKRSDAEILSRIAQLSKELGIDAKLVSDSSKPLPAVIQHEPVNAQFDEISDLMGAKMGSKS